LNYLKFGDIGRLDRIHKIFGRCPEDCIKNAADMEYQVLECEQTIAALFSG